MGYFTIAIAKLVGPRESDCSRSTKTHADAIIASSQGWSTGSHTIRHQTREDENRTTETVDFLSGFLDAARVRDRKRFLSRLPRFFKL